MSHPLVHAERSARQWGGTPDDYLRIHSWFDATRGHLPDNRHRLVLHHSFGVLLAEQVFGPAVQLADGRRAFVREIAAQHVRDDLGGLPTLADCFADVVCAPWMAGALAARPSPTTSGDPTHAE
jgi:hypothetical protein